MRIILALLLLLPTFVFSQLNQSDENGLRQGKWEKRQANGRLIYEGQFKDDKPIGEWKRYHPGGQLKALMVYKGDSAHTQLFDEWRKKLSEGIFVNQKKEGTWKIYKNGVKVAEEGYSAGIRNGISRKFYDSGQLMEESDWQNDRQSGNYEVFYKSGEPYIQCKMVNGTRNGLFLIYFLNGRQQLVGEYKNDLRHGEWKYYNEQGELLYVLNYQEGVLLNPNVRDSVANIEMKSLEKNKGAILDPETFMQDPSQYMMKSQQKR